MSRKLVAALMAPGIAIAIAGCGSTSTTSTTAPTCPDPAPAASGASFTLEARDFCFSPGTINVAAGQKVTVTFVNKGEKEHNLTVGGTDVGEAQKGETQTLTFTAAAGATDFFCKYHKDSNGMVGKLVVSGTGGSGAPASSAPAPATTPSKYGGY
jgi:plastocyanin